MFSLLLLGQAKGPDLFGMLPMFVIVLGVFYFIVFRPQQKQLKDQQLMLAGLKKGDEVVLQSGLIGKVFSVADKEVMVELAPGVKVRALKSAVQGKPPAAPEVKADEAQAKKEEK
jgi:preprotein translocase subunit YajC